MKENEYLILPASHNSQMGMGWFQESTDIVYSIQMALHGVLLGAEDSTMVSYFSNYQIQEHQPKIALSTVADLQCPVLQSSSLRGDPEVACSAPELLDWLGAVFSHAELCVRGSRALGLCWLPAFNRGFIL